MNLDLELLAQIIGTLSVIAGGVAALMAWINRMLTKTITDQLEPLAERVNDLESWTGKQQLDIEHSRRYNIVITKGVTACLYGLQEQGCNGKVTTGIEEMNNFLLEQANQGKSKQKEVIK